MRSDVAFSGSGHAEEQLREIDYVLAGELVSSQFPQWAHLPISPIAAGGWDNRSFRLGQDMVMRLPSAAAYASQVEKEHHWLPRLAPLLPLEIPTPVAIGSPGCGYPWRWSIYRWIEGEAATPEIASASGSFAIGVAEFLIALHRIDPAGGPLPGTHNFFRGGPLSTYDAETREAIAIVKQGINAAAATEAWEAALATTWAHPAVWVHGDLAAGNLLIHRGELSAVIDFGGLGIGDPACDLAIAWTLLPSDARRSFRNVLPFDAGTWTRARAWALWKALIVSAGLSTTNAIEFANPWHIIAEVLDEVERGIDA
jgi:aminoglycoside phosphotransferase (APT) family kinase protein